MSGSGTLPLYKKQREHEEEGDKESMNKKKTKII
jgi:hypothetical protein